MQYYASLCARLAGKGSRLRSCKNPLQYPSLTNEKGDLEDIGEGGCRRNDLRREPSELLGLYRPIRQMLYACSRL